MEKTTTKKGIALIKSFEGFSPLEYTCIAGKRTIGYGHVLDVEESYIAGVSEAKAEELLSKDLKHAENIVRSKVVVPLKAHQFDALVSFVFNVGAGNFSRSMLLRLLNEGKYEEIPSQLMRWVYVNGALSAGLMRRRHAEAEMFSKRGK